MDERDARQSGVPVKLIGVGGPSFPSVVFPFHPVPIALRVFQSNKSSMVVLKRTERQPKPPPVIAVSMVEDEAPAREAMSAILRGTPGFKLLSIHESAKDG